MVFFGASDIMFPWMGVLWLICFYDQIITILHILNIIYLIFISSPPHPSQRNLFNDLYVKELNAGHPNKISIIEAASKVAIVAA